VWAEAEKGRGVDDLGRINLDMWSGGSGAGNPNQGRGKASECDGGMMGQR
jgi:hypothetical protein